MSKWLNKKRQAAKEALNKNAEHTDVDPGYMAMEAEIDATRQIVEGMVKKLPHFIHPNPAERLKMSVQKKGAAKPYRHAILELIDLMQKHGQELDDDSSFGKAVAKTAEAFQSLLDLQYDMDNALNQSVIEPWKRQIDQEFKDIAYHRKKVRTRRLDFDFKRTTNASNVAKGKPEKYPESDVKVAKEKFEESKSNAEAGMGQMIDNDTEQITQLKALIDAQQNYHAASAEKLAELSGELDRVASDGASREKRVYAVKSAPVDAGDSDNEEEEAAPASPAAPDANTPCAKALYDFVPENDGELAFSDGDMITLVSRLDENWLEGELNGQSGIFPSNYVEVVREP